MSETELESLDYVIRHFWADSTAMTPPITFSDIWKCCVAMRPNDAFLTSKRKAHTP